MSVQMTPFPPSNPNTRFKSRPWRRVVDQGGRQQCWPFALLSSASSFIRDEYMGGEVLVEAIPGATYGCAAQSAKAGYVHASCALKTPACSARPMASGVSIFGAKQIKSYG